MNTYWIQVGYDEGPDLQTDTATAPFQHRHTHLHLLYPKFQYWPTLNGKANLDIVYIYKHDVLKSCTHALSWPWFAMITRYVERYGYL